jgi:ATP-dependent Lon protease
VNRYVRTEEYYEAEASVIAEDLGEPVEVEALARSVVSEFESYVKLNKKVSAEVWRLLARSRISRSWPTLSPRTSRSRFRQAGHS